MTEKERLERMVEAVVASGRFDEPWRIILFAKQILEQLDDELNSVD